MSNIKKKDNKKIKDIYLLSPMQEGMLYHSLLYSESNAYFEQSFLSIEGSLDVKYLEKSLNMLIERYDILRTVFVYENVERPVQVVMKERKAHIHFEDIIHLPELEKKAFIEEFKMEDRRRGFDLRKDLPMRISVVRTGNELYKLLWSFHHIIMDGWCMGIIRKEFLAIYHSLKENRQINLGKVYPYSDYINWLTQQDREEATLYWERYLSDYEERAQLPPDKGIVTDGKYELAEVAFRINESTRKGLENIVKKNNVTLNTIVQSAWGILLQRYNNTNDVVFGAVVSGRPHEVKGIENMVGLFINTLPVRIKCSGNESFARLVNRVQQFAVESERFSYYPLAEIQANTGLKSSLVDHIVVFENYPVEEGLGANEIGFAVGDSEAYEQTNYNFNMIVVLGKELTVKFNYNALVYDQVFIKRIQGHFQTVIDRIIENPNVLVRDIDILTEEERHELLSFNNTQAEYPKYTLIHELFEEQVKKNPDYIAVNFEQEKLTYQELNNKANQLARVLCNKGVKRNSIVGIMTERSPEMIIGLMGILKAGGAYLPIDPEYPEDRISYMLADSRTDILLTQQHLVGKEAFPRETIYLDDPNLYSGDSSNLLIEHNSRDVAYVIYTSGSSGKPKGVEIEHTSLVNLVSWHRRVYNITFMDRATQLAGQAFDASVWEIWPYLTSGAALWIPDNETRTSTTGLIQWLKDNLITVSFMPTPMAEALLAEEWPSDIHLRALLTGGDKLHRRPSKEIPFTLVNHYGPTENTVVTTWASVSSDEPKDALPSIGRPMDNTQIYIVGRNNNLQPVGIAGELCISGDGLAKGYLNRPELTAEKFVANPFVSGRRMYRSGDLARWQPDGNIEFLGRMDYQVKIRGFRIELGEIEAELINYPSIKEAVVIDRDDASGQKYLCAFIVAERELTTKELRGHLSQILPEYMIPSTFIQLEKMPLTPNGKIDRKVLPEPEGRVSIGTEYVAPRNEGEEKLAQIWQNVLGVEKVGIEDNFFELGGHSLKAISLVAKVHKEFGTQVPLQQIFKAQTIKELIKIINGAAENNYAAIEAVAEQEYYPVSSAQKRMFILNQFGANGTAYNMSAAFKVEGILDKHRFEEVWKKLIQRHETLRTSFELINGEPVQRVHKEPAFIIDCFYGGKKDIGDIFEKFVCPFDLSKAPLLRVGLVELDENSHVVLFDMHHIISDGVSMGILAKELASLYEGLELPELQIQYKDFSAWQKNLLASESFKKQEAYWLQTLAGELPVLNMPSDYPRPPVKSFEGDWLTFTLEEELTKELNKLAMETGTTLYMVLMAAYNILLSKYTDQEDIIVGTPITGRPHANLENIVGMFVNTLTIRNFPAGSKSFLEFLREVKENALQGYEHQDYQFEELVDKLDIARDLSRNPMFDTMFSLQNMDIAVLEFNNLEFTPYEFANKTAKFDLSVEAIEVNSRLEFTMQYYTKLFKRESIERLGRHFISILESIVVQPQIKITDIEILSEKEKNQILYDFNNTETVYPQDKTIQDLFENQVKRQPDNIAILFGDLRITYGELNNKANQLARVLRSKGVTANSIVGIMVERSPEMMIGIMGILKAGGAYLPIDPKYPPERIGYVLTDSGASILLTQEHLFHIVPFKGETIDLDHQGLYSGDHTNLIPVNTPQDLAYVIYTSGSTGKPKGVEIEHHSLVNMLSWLQNQYPITAEDIILQKTSFTFDASVWEVLWWAMAGAKVCFLEPQGEKDPGKIIKAISENKVTVIQFVPSLLNILLEYIEEQGNLEHLSSLKMVFVGGEALQPNLVETFHKTCNKKFNVKLINQYGPTEATIDASYFDCRAEEKLESIPIGKPIDNINLYIMSGTNKLQPVGIAGEICIAGEGLARGYVNRPELTAEKFVENPFLPGEKMYRTGDLARWLPDGNMEYLGRMDHQVKIRGFRIELGEIEAELLRQPSIKETVVIAKEDINGDKYLCAYLVAVQALTIGELREHLSKKMPDYMIPSAFVQLDKMPLTSNGKIDRKALPEPEGQINTGAEYVAPRNAEEEKLAKIWQTVLGAPKVGIEDNFFELGGHSLKAITIVAKIHKEFGAEISLQEVFKAQTIKEMIKIIEGAGESDYATIESVAKQEYYPVSSAQKRMFILNQFEPENVTYNMPAVFTVEGALDKERLENVFKTLIQRHETLRTSFAVIDREPVQRVHTEIEFTIDSIQKRGEDITEIVQSFVRPFDLGEAGLLRVGLIELRENKHIVLFDMHHIISDGVSMGILIKELVGLYEGQELPGLPIQYKDFSAWQNEMLRSPVLKKQEAYWLKVFAGEIPVLNMPSDYPRPIVRSFAGDRLNFSTGEELTEALNKLAMKTGTTLYMVLLAAYNVLLSKYTGQEDIIVGSPIAGRDHADLENMVGMFVNTLAMRNKPAENKSFLEFLQEVKDKALDGYEYQDYQFEELVDKLNITRNLSRNPLFDTLFTVQNAGATVLEINNLRFSPYEFEHKVAKFDLTLEAIEVNSRLEFILEYYTKLFKKETVERLGRHFVNILKSIAAQPEIKLGDIELASEDEKQQILIDFNNTKTTYPQDKTIQELFEEQVEKDPDHIAITFEEQRLTYRELNHRANQLARTLRKKGVKTNSIVGMMVERSPEMIIGIMGILKAGGAYLPIDPEYPGERINYMLEDSGTKILVTQKHLADTIAFNGDIIDLDDMGLDKEDTANLIKVNTSRDLAYVIYTSGSTGKPKGNLTMHYNVVRVVKNTNYIEITVDDVLLQLSNYAFDGSVFDIYGALLNGGKLVLIDKGNVVDMNRLSKVIDQEKVTVFFITTALFNTLVDVNIECLKNIRKILFGGEMASAHHVRKAYEYMGSGRLVHVYGPTETTVYATYYEIKQIQDGQMSVPIGAPIANTCIYILSQAGKLQPIGVPGELCIAGDGLASGYLNRPELTAEKFVENPFMLGDKMYRTGDLARWLPDGNIEFLGRIDHQIKLRGFRIELGEIESRLISHSLIKEALVIVKDDVKGNQYLCAYIAAEGDNVISQIRGYLDQTLPQYMIPSVFVQLEKMPLTPNGKIDRRALPEPEGRVQTKREYIAPRNEVEEKLAEIWQEILGVEKVGMEDNFFELGGYSLKVITLVAEIGEEFGVEIPYDQIFKNPTITELAKCTEKSDTVRQVYSDYIKFNENNSEHRNLFFFPPAVPLGLIYRHLAAELEEYTLYCFNLVESEAKIKEYVKIITGIQSQGPYTLAGFSAGGILTVAVARELEKQGYDVAGILLLDCQYVKIPDESMELLMERVDDFIRKMDISEKEKKNIKKFIQSKTMNYLNYLNGLLNDEKIIANIYQIYSHKGQQSCSKADEWTPKTMGNYMEYKGFGTHDVMLEPDYVKGNAQVIKQIVCVLQPDPWGGKI
jgi:amino acid adenylation domain-containing protein